MPPPGMPGGRGGRFGPMTPEEKAAAPKITGALLKRIFSYLAPYWMHMVLIIVAILISSGLATLPSVLTGQIMDKGLIGGFNAVNAGQPVDEALGLLVRLILLSFAVFIVSQLINVGESYLNTWVGQHITFDMKNKLYAHLQKMSHRFYSTSKQGDIITRMTSDIDGVQQTITGTLLNIIQNAATLVIALALMFSMDWRLAILGIVLVPFFIIPTKVVGTKRWELTRLSQEKNDEINQILNETLSVSGQQLVKLFTTEDKEYNKYYETNKARVALNIRESMVGRWFMLAIGTFTQIGPMLIYLVGGLLMMKYGSTLTPGEITVMVALLGRLYGPVNSLLNIQVDLTRSMANFTRLFSYFDMPIEIDNAPDALTPDSVTGDIAFNHVSFHYDPDKEILKDVSFTVPAGKSVAIVGPSGAGKSTIISLIPRLYDVIDGSITIDGNDVRKLDLQFLRRNVGVVNQDTYLFNGTIRENLLYANDKSTDEQIIQACKDANIHAFIEGLPNGYETEIGNRGIKLSGGERQRVSIARAILKNTKILILDEATSSLDSISESLIQDAIDPLLQGRTSLVIAHRLSTIMSADEILVVKDGVIVERGTHRDLVPLNGVYTELYETQFRRALQEERARLAGEEPADEYDDAEATEDETDDLAQFAGFTAPAGGFGGGFDGAPSGFGGAPGGFGGAPGGFGGAPGGFGGAPGGFGGAPGGSDGAPRAPGGQRGGGNGPRGPRGGGDAPRN